MPNNVTELLRGVVSELREITRSETIVGEPVTVGSKTVIPIVKISVGFGVGGGEGEAGKAGTGFGGGGGGGAKIEPSAFIIMEDDDVKLLLASKGKWESIIDAVPGFARKLGKVIDKISSDRNGKDGESDAPESTDTGDEPSDAGATGDTDK